MGLCYNPNQGPVSPRRHQPGKKAWDYLLAKVYFNLIHAIRFNLCPRAYSKMSYPPHPQALTEMGIKTVSQNYSSSFKDFLQARTKGFNLRTIPFYGNIAY